MNSELSEAVQSMQKIYGEFKAEVETYKEVGIESDFLEHDLAMMGIYFAGFSTSLGVMERVISGKKPDSFSNVRIALGKVEGKKPLWYHIRDIGRDYSLKIEGVKDLLRYVPEVITYAESHIRQTSISQKAVSEEPKTPIEDKPYAVVPREKIGYPGNFKNLVKSNDKFFQVLGQTRQASRLKSVWQKLDADLVAYSIGEDSASLVTVPDKLTGEARRQIWNALGSLRSLENVDEVLFGKLTDYGNEMKGFVDQEKEELDREIEARLAERSDRERIPSQEF